MSLKLTFGIQRVYCTCWHFWALAYALAMVRSYIHSVVCRTSGPQPLPKRILHKTRSSDPFFSFEYPIFSLTLSSSCLFLLPRLPVTYILPSIFPTITCISRQFLRKMWPIPLAFLTLLHVRFSSPNSLYKLCLNFSHERSSELLHHFLALHFKTFQVYLNYFPKCPIFGAIQTYKPNVAL
jgi:hypothetical protein